ncbi:glycoside hydrolase [Dactylonectria macrodidyma]|uniref:alpha-1,2-Mannosidase n=1 Tax=Dactylonectria macrodidyma TaxID=307937 RepID=A0A9P9EYD2_9HYPO|nr:glycoside hydrolase [Dactylonectria macrodidyma]
MIAQCQGRLSRRYIALIVLLGVGYFLYHNLRPQDYMRATKVGAVKYLPSSYDWSKNTVYYPVEDIKSPPATDQPQKLPPVQHQWHGSSENDVSQVRKAIVKKAFVKSWNAYKKYAWPQDELKPLSRKGKQSFSGWSAQLVDALDTLWLLDMQADFKLAVEQVALIDWARTSDDFLNLFEVTIRHLGGLLAAYDLSGEHVLLAKATELGDMLYATFDTPNRLPSHWLYFAKAKEGKQTADDSMSGAAGCSMGLEFTRLSQITGDPKYYDATERVKQFIYHNQNETKLPGLWPHTMNYRKETVTASMFTLGAGADSLYEYLPKMHAILGGLDPEYVQMTTLALDTATKHLLYKPINVNDTNILMAGNAVAGSGKIELTNEMQHLTCFVGGTYGLAGKLLSRDDLVELGSRLTAGCVWAYDSFPTNIMPEIAELKACPSIDGECRYEELKPKSSQLPPGFTRVRDARYLLRPEAIESVFYMWRITGDEIWRDAAWRMWEGIVKEAENDLAFASVSDVRYEGSTQDDAMETFWMSETLKYFWLIFEDHKVLNLDDWVLNTEAHPFKRPSS